MIRLEIIANNTVEEDIQNVFNQIDKDFSYTRVNSVHGRGHSSPRMGNAVWPEENFIYIIYADEDTAKDFIDAIRKIKKEFTREGIKIFAVPVVELL
jgi:nitrogen regulatory protein PII